MRMLFEVSTFHVMPFIDFLIQKPLSSVFLFLLFEALHLILRRFCTETF